MIEPRFGWAPPATRSLGPDAVAFWKAAGGRLFSWQERVIEGILGLDDEGRWVTTDDGLNVARQNGKGVVLQVIEAYCAFELGYPVVMHTAHEFATSQEHQLRLESFIQEAPHLHSRVKDRGGYVHANGQESIRLKSGVRIIFKARTKGAGRGYSGDLLVWDEAMVVPDQVVGAQKPMTRASSAKHGHKTIWAGSAVDEVVHEYGVNFARLRERGMAEDPRVSWHEWSAPVDVLELVDDEVLHDRGLWVLANPSMAEGLIREETMADEIAQMASRTAAVELLGIGDWPDTSGRDQSLIKIGQWDACQDDDSQLQLDGLCLAFDVSPERWTSIAAAGRNQNGDYHVEIQEHKQGTRWVVERLVEMVERGNPDVVVCDGVGPAASLLVALKDAGVRVETVNAQEHGQACGRLLDMVEEGTLRHLGSQELRDAVRGAKPRPLGDAWAWSRKTSAVDISPLVAATLALGAAAGVAGTAELVIY